MPSTNSYVQVSVPHVVVLKDKCFVEHCRSPAVQFEEKETSVGPLSGERLQRNISWSCAAVP